ncbi:MAG: hypothetical protein GY888_29315 [Planctomycetaceae bacterium]|nr:hypothetical protein [Planctomycetaceae bacterium]
MNCSRFAPRAGRFLGLVSAVLVGLFSGSATLQASLVWDADPANYGYLWQYSVAPPIGAEACGPTSTTNAFTYLQNTQSGRIGNVLTGNDYADWLQTADTLANDYMQTGGSDKPQAEQGTKYWDLATGMQQYAQDRGAKIHFDGVFVDPRRETAGTMPDWVKLQDKGPTIDQLYNMLAGGAGVVMGMNPGPQTGHIVTLAGMDWDDINGDGIVDPGEATLSIIDPLDPSSHDENPDPEPYGADGLQPQQAVLTTLDVWQTTAPDPKTGEPVSVLKIEYWQYQGSKPPSEGQYGPYNRSYGQSELYISGAFSMAAVPEPTSVLVWSSLVLGFTLTRRRRMA